MKKILKTVLGVTGLTAAIVWSLHGVDLRRIGGDLHAMMRNLSRGAPIGFVCDRSLDGKGVETKLFNKRIRLPLSMVDYSLRHKVPIYVAYCVKEQSGLRLFCRRLDSSLGFNGIVGVITSILEDAIRRYPFQWHMMSAL
jgi:lauroyl/myristoyl acyltransferase